MAVVNVKEGWSGRPGGGDANRVWATRLFTVLTDDPLTNAIEVLEHEDIPNQQDPHPVNEDLLVVNLYADPKGPMFWEVRADYESRGAWGSDPFSEPYQYFWGWQTSEQPVYQDINGKPIHSSSLEPFDPYPTREHSDAVLTVIRNESVLDTSMVMAYQDALNSDWFFGAAPGQCKMRVTGQRITGGAVIYWSVRYDIVHRRDGWRVRRLDEGMRELVGVDNDGKPKFANITDQNGDPVTQPVKLNGSGKKLASGADPVYGQWDVYPVAPYGPLNLFAGV